MDDFVRDELVACLGHLRREIAAIMDIHGIGRYTSLVIVGELGEIERFRFAQQVASYAGLTSQVRQSGDHCYY